MNTGGPHQNTSSNLYNTYASKRNATHFLKPSCSTLNLAVKTALRTEFNIMSRYVHTCEHQHDVIEEYQDYIIEISISYNKFLEEVRRLNLRSLLKSMR